MLQIPASLEGNGVTLGIPNCYLVCCSYFYLSMVEFLRRNERRLAMHFLQAVSICPRIVCGEFAPGVFDALFPLFVRHGGGKCCCSLDDFDEGMVDDVMRWMARRFKPWLMYYHIMSAHDFGPTKRVSVTPNRVESLDMQRNGLRSNPNQSIADDVREVVPKRVVAHTAGSSSIKCLKDIQTEYEPDTPKSSHSYNTDSSLDDSPYQSYAEDQEAEDINQQSSLSWRRRREANETKALECIPWSYATSLYDAPLGLQSMHQYLSFSRISKSLSCRATLNQEDTLLMEHTGLVERIISKLCFTEEMGSYDQDYMVEMKTRYELLNTKSGLKYSLLKDMILDQLLTAISTSKEERVVRTSVSRLSTIVTTNIFVLDDIKRKGLQLYDLATALKRNVHEAVILIYLISPSPAEIKALDLLPCLVEVICASTSYKLELLTPPAASLMIIEMLVNAFDSEASGMHLAVISSPRVISGLLQVPRREKLEEYVSLASILVRCMQFHGKCRKYISEFAPLSPFVYLLWSNQEGASSTALEFFNELLRMPRFQPLICWSRFKNKEASTICVLYSYSYRILKMNTNS